MSTAAFNIMQIIEAQPGWRVVFAAPPPPKQAVMDGQPNQVLEPQAAFRPIAAWALGRDGDDQTARVVALTAREGHGSLVPVLVDDPLFLGICAPMEPDTRWKMAAKERWAAVESTLRAQGRLP